MTGISNKLGQACRTLRERRGESLVESVVAFLVIAVILIAFAAFVNLGSHLTAETSQLDQQIGSSYQNAGTATIAIDGTTQGTVTLSKNEADIYRYGAASDSNSNPAASSGSASISNTESSSTSAGSDSGSSADSTTNTSASSPSTSSDQ